MGHELRIGRWRFDPASGELRCADTTRRLEPRVAQVLEYLAVRPHQIVSREELLGSLWRDSHVVDAVVWRAVSELRRALDDPADEPRFVETVPRRGYRLIADVQSVREPRRLWPAAAAALIVLTLSLATLGRPYTAAARGNTLPAHIGNLPASAAQLYASGMRYYRRYSLADNRMARVMFVQALALDPEFVPARAGLANSLALDFSRFDADTQTLDEAIAHARRALRADPDSAEAHKALGFAYQTRGWLDMGAAATRRAIDLNPEFSEAIHNYAGALDAVGRPVESLRWRLRQPLRNTDEALLFVGIGNTMAAVGDWAAARRYLELALVAEPYSRYASFELARIEAWQGDARQAHERLQTTLAHHPDCGECHALLGDADRTRGRDEEARQHYHDGTQAFGGVGDRAAWTRLAGEYMRTGADDAADRILQRLTGAATRRIDDGDQRHEPRLSLAIAESLRGRPDAALEHLIEAVDHGLYDPAVLEHEPAFDDLRSHPEYIRLRRELRIRTEQARTEIDEIGL